MSERKTSAEQVREEHATAVSATRHVLYLAGVIGGAMVLMLILLVLLEATTP
jgi:hypothetical protein